MKRKKIHWSHNSHGKAALEFAPLRMHSDGVTNGLLDTQLMDTLTPRATLMHLISAESTSM